ncbi:extracellular solute-binding protein [Candidatus Epulonipiscium viviparus]|uniref:extracellular solute-binding protein n=1 Tax=Candidatus Epulonipiscium viviparus TaxID=420336 RepID=UPI0004966743|nr:extracellular solute-binding protein [Candidatus Epulopiscium viviparus]
MKKTLRTALLAVLLTTSLVACGGEEEKVAVVHDGPEGIGEFEYWLGMHSITSKAVTDHNDHPAAARLEAQTGMKVDYVSPPVGQEKSQMNLLLAGGNDGMPDLFRYNLPLHYRGGVDGALADGVILDITDLVEEYAPNYMARINASEDMKKGAYTDSGVLAYFGSTLPDPEMQGLPFNGPMVNKNLLDKAGLDIPITIADWEEMLLAFKDMGVKIPFSFGANNEFSGLFYAFSSAYGVAPGAEFINVDGTVKFGPLEPGYKDFLQLFSKWYNMELLDQDYLSKNQAKDIRPDFDAGIMGASVLHANSIISAPSTSVKLGNEKVEVLITPYPVLNVGDQIHLRDYVEPFNQSPAYISSNAKNPIEIIQWVDYLYSPEGVNEISWGTLGTGKDDMSATYYIDENGKHQYTDFYWNHPDGLTTNEVQRQYMLRDSAMVWDWENQSLMYSDPQYQVAWDTWASNADYSYIMPQTLTMTLEENDRYSKIMSDVTTYVNEMAAKFIMGIESFDKYDDFLATLNKMKIQEVIDIQQSALDRYLVR